MSNFISAVQSQIKDLSGDIGQKAPSDDAGLFDDVMRQFKPDGGDKKSGHQQASSDETSIAKPTSTETAPTPGQPANVAINRPGPVEASLLSPSFSKVIESGNSSIFTIPAKQLTAGNVGADPARSTIQTSDARFVSIDAPSSTRIQNPEIIRAGKTDIPAQNDISQVLRNTETASISSDSVEEGNEPSIVSESTFGIDPQSVNPDVIVAPVAGASTSVIATRGVEESIKAVGSNVADHVSRTALDMGVDNAEVATPDIKVPTITVLKAETHFKPVVEGFVSNFGDASERTGDKPGQQNSGKTAFGSGRAQGGVLVDELSGRSIRMTPSVAPVRERATVTPVMAPANLSSGLVRSAEAVGAGGEFDAQIMEGPSPVSHRREQLPLESDLQPLRNATSSKPDLAVAKPEVAAPNVAQNRDRASTSQHRPVVVDFSQSQVKEKASENGASQVLDAISDGVQFGQGSGATKTEMSPGIRAFAAAIEKELGAFGRPVKAGLVELLSPAHTVSARASQEAVRQLTIQLKPAELGLVNVSLKLEGDVLELRLEVQTEEAARMLTKDREALCATLRASGYRPEVVSVVVAGANSQQPHNGSQTPQQADRGNDPGQHQGQQGSGDQPGEHARQQNGKGGEDGNETDDVRRLFGALDF